jgi:hypothetical protein
MKELLAAVSHYERLEKRDPALPGVTSAAIASAIPLARTSILFEVEVDGYQKDLARLGGQSRLPLGTSRWRRPQESRQVLRVD